MRDVTVTVDDREVARLRQGKEAVVSVEAGCHGVPAQMDWATSLPLHVEVQAEKAVVSVALSGSATWRSLMTPVRALAARQGTGLGDGPASGSTGEASSPPQGC